MADKIKVINPPPIQARVTGPDGKEHVFTAKTLTKVELEEWDKLNSGGMSGVPVGEQLPKLVAFIYGKNPSDFFNWDIRILKALVQHFTNELTNPTA